MQAFRIVLTGARTGHKSTCTPKRLGLGAKSSVIPTTCVVQASHPHRRCGRGQQRLVSAMKSSKFGGNCRMSCGGGGYEWRTQSRLLSRPNPSNFCSIVDTEHTPINLPDSHHDFQFQDDAAVIFTTDPEGLPRSGASSSSKQTAASRVSSLFGLSSLFSGKRFGTTTCSRRTTLYSLPQFKELASSSRELRLETAGNYKEAGK